MCTLAVTPCAATGSALGWRQLLIVAELGGSLRSSQRQEQLAGSLFLGGHLGVAIAPRAELQAAAHPAQTFVRVGGALAGADRASPRLLEAVGFDRQPSLLQENFWNNRLRQGRCGWRLRSFPSHN